MIVLGIDPGITRIGYGVISKESGIISCLDYGLVKRPNAEEEIVGIKIVISEIGKLVKKYKPDIAAVEKLFFFKNQKTIISVGEMKGVILAALAMNNIPVKEFTPLQVKQAVSSYGRADKNQVESMVRLILNLKEKVKPDDAADGLAIAICCLNTII